MVSKKTGSVLSGKASVITNAASTYNIDPLYFLCQTIHESGYGTSTLAKGKAVTQVITGDSLSPKGATGTKVTAFKTVSKDVKTAGEKKGKKYYKVNNNAFYEVKNISSKKVYNLYGIKAYDNAPQLGGFSYAYYQGWTSVDKAIQGAAKYVSDNYIHHGTYKQNTLYKIRYSPYLQDLGHQYASDPAYAQSIGKLMNTYQSVYSSTSGFIYDTPVFN